MRNFYLAFVCLLLFSPWKASMALTVEQLFNGGQGSTDESCDIGGRIVYVSELKTITDFCDHVPGEWSIQKARGPEKDEFWQVMGWGYSCNMKPGGGWNSSICIMQNEPQANQVFAFTGFQYSGVIPWGGKAKVLSEQEQLSSGKIRSLKIGSDLHVVAYSEENFNGHMEIISEDLSESSFVIKSLKVESKIDDHEINVGMTSSNHRVCILVKISDESVTVCSDDTERYNLGSTAEYTGKEVELSVSLYAQKESDDYLGQLFLEFNESGSGFYINNDKSKLPQGLSVSLSGAYNTELLFSYSYVNESDSDTDSELTDEVTVSSSPVVSIGSNANSSSTSSQYALVTDKKSVAQGFRAAKSSSSGLETDASEMSTATVTDDTTQEVSVHFNTTQAGMCLLLTAPGFAGVKQCRGEDIQQFLTIPKSSYIPIKVTIVDERSILGTSEKGVILLVSDSNGGFSLNLDGTLLPKKLSVLRVNKTLDFKY